MGSAIFTCSYQLTIICIEGGSTSRGAVRSATRQSTQSTLTTRPPPGPPLLLLVPTVCERPVVWDAVAHALVDAGAHALGELAVVEGRGVCARADDHLVHLRQKCRSVFFQSDRRGMRLRSWSHRHAPEPGMGTRTLAAAFPFFTAALIELPALSIPYPLPMLSTCS